MDIQTEQRVGFLRTELLAFGVGGLVLVFPGLCK